MESLRPCYQKSNSRDQPPDPLPPVNAILDEDGAEADGPLSVKDDLWLAHYNDEQWFRWFADGHDHGKWMLFYDEEKLEEAWKKAKWLYDEERLDGIFALEVSTGAEGSFRYQKNGSGVIIFHCGPTSNEQKMVEYGEKVVNLMDYHFGSQRTHGHHPPLVYFKTDEMTSFGTRATGQIKNHLYKIKMLNWQKYLDLGKWTIAYDEDNLDEALVKAKKHLEDGELGDIKSVSASPYSRERRLSGEKTRALHFLCGPYMDCQKMIRLGRLVLGKMEYHRGSQQFHNDAEFKEFPFVTFKNNQFRDDTNDEANGNWYTQEVKVYRIEVEWPPVEEREDMRSFFEKRMASCNSKGKKK